MDEMFWMAGLYGGKYEQAGPWAKLKGERGAHGTKSVLFASDDMRVGIFSFDPQDLGNPLW